MCKNAMSMVNTVSPHAMRLTRRECVVYQGSSSPTPSPEEAAKLVEFISILPGPTQASSRTARRTQEKAKWGLVVCRVSCSARAQARRRGGPVRALRLLPSHVAHSPPQPVPPLLQSIFFGEDFLTDSIRKAIVTESGEREREREVKSPGGQRFNSRWARRWRRGGVPA